MKVIEVLNKIANGEELPKLKLEHSDDNDIGFELYMKIGENNGYNFNECLNEEIEIIEEEKKIEKLNLDKDELLKNVIITAQDYVIEGKINELIDEVNKLKGKNE